MQTVQAAVQAARPIRIITMGVVIAVLSYGHHQHKHKLELRAGHPTWLARKTRYQPANRSFRPPGTSRPHSNTARNKQARNSPAGERTLQLDMFQAGGAEGMWRHVDRPTGGCSPFSSCTLVHSRKREWKLWLGLIQARGGCLGPTLRACFPASSPACTFDMSGRWMDRWMDGWMDGWMMDGYTGAG